MLARISNVVDLSHIAVMLAHPPHELATTRGRVREVHALADLPSADCSGLELTCYDGTAQLRRDGQTSNPQPCFEVWIRLGR